MLATTDTTLPIIVINCLSIHDWIFVVQILKTCGKSNATIGIAEKRFIGCSLYKYLLLNKHYFSFFLLLFHWSIIRKFP